MDVIKRLPLTILTYIPSLLGSQMLLYLWILFTHSLINDQHIGKDRRDSGCRSTSQESIKHSQIWRKGLIGTGNRV